MRPQGFSIIELLVVVAIIGVLAAVGIPMYQGYVQNTKDSNAKNNLNSIFMTQEEYKADYNEYYFTNTVIPCTEDQTEKINEVLFEETQVLDESNNKDFKYCIGTTTSGTTYKAYAIKSSDSNKKFAIDEKRSTE